MEMMAAVAMAGLLVGIFYSVMHRIRDMERLALEQGLALVILENVVERLAADPTAGMDAAERILQAEFEESALHIPSRYTAACIEGEGGFGLRVVRASGVPVAGVEVRR
jgi:transcription termination factor Rho